MKTLAQHFKEANKASRLMGEAIEHNIESPVLSKALAMVHRIPPGLPRFACAAAVLAVLSLAAAFDAEQAHD